LIAVCSVVSLDCRPARADDWGCEYTTDDYSHTYRHQVRGLLRLRERGKGAAALVGLARMSERCDDERHRPSHATTENVGTHDSFERRIE
jgi:hypothetical protein